MKPFKALEVKFSYSEAIAPLLRVDSVSKTWCIMCYVPTAGFQVILEARIAFEKRK